MRKIKLVTKVLAYIVSVSIVIQSVPTYGAEKTAVNEFSTNEMYEVESSIEELSEIGTSIEEKYEAELSIEETEKSSETESSTNEQVSEIESIEDKLSEVERSIEETEETSETEYSEEKFSSIEFVDEENSFVEESFTNSEEMFSDEETSEEELSTEEELCVIEYSNDGEYILGDPVMGEYGDYEGIVTYDLGTTSDNSYPTTPGVASRSFEEIKNYLKSSGASINDPVRYATNPVLKAPYASGALDDQTLNSGLAMVNQIRYIAGLSPVTLNSTYNKYAQSAALIQKLNGCLNHYPDKPEGIDEDLYKEGCLGSIKSNLAFSHSTLNYEILLYMNDSDNTNIDRVGHRRWLLFSNLHQIGLGKVGESSAAYVIGDDFSLESSVKGIVWPAQTMPINYFGKDHAWSVCIGEDVNQATASVKLTRVRDNKVWNFTQSGSDGYFNINNDYYGDVGCIIFRPNGIAGYSNGDTFNVEISYNNTKFTYTVNFFDVNQNIRKYTDEEKKELHRSLPNPKLYISSADTGNVYKLSEIALPEGWYWMHPDTNIYTQDSYNNYMVVYRKSGYEDYLDWVFISIVNLDNISVMGESTIGSRDMAVYSSSLGTDLKLADGTKITVRWELGSGLELASGNLTSPTVIVKPTNPNVPASSFVTFVYTINGKEYRTKMDVTIKLDEVKVQNVPIDKATITINKYNAKYTGEQIRPSIVVKLTYTEDGSSKIATLTKGIDYVVDYKNNINAGTAIVEVIGIGLYTGVVSKSYTIEPKSIQNVTVTSVGDILYGQEPNVVVMDGKYELVKGKDYNIRYEKGSATENTVSKLYVDAATNSNYIGTAKSSPKFNILPTSTEALSIANAVVTLKTNKTYTYNGNQIKPAVVVTLNGTKIVSSKYKVMYSNNVNAGTATIKVVGKSSKGKGYYGVSNPITFKINQKSIAKTSTSSNINIPVTNNLKDIKFLIKDGRRVLADGIDYTIDFSSVASDDGQILSDVKIGKKYKIYAKATGNGNYIKDTTKTLNITFVRLDLGAKGADVKVSVIDKSKSIVNVTYNGVKLIQGVDYKAKVSYNKNKKLYTVKITAISKGNYKGSRTVKVLESN